MLVYVELNQPIVYGSNDEILSSAFIQEFSKIDIHSGFIILRSDDDYINIRMSNVRKIQISNCDVDFE